MVTVMTMMIMIMKNLNVSRCQGGPHVNLRCRDSEQ